MKQKEKILRFTGVAFPLCNNEHVSHVYPTEQPVFALEETKVEGRIMTKQVVKTIDRREQEKGNKVSDFCLENQIAIGSQLLGHSVCYGADATDSILSAASAAMANMDKAAAAAAAAQSSKSTSNE